MSNPKSTDYLELSDANFENLLKQHAKWKQRSHDTHHNTHIPELASWSSDKRLRVVLIGDSMLERFKTTGSSTRVGTLSNAFNAGVGGDKIENVLYRIDQGLLKALAQTPPELWVLTIGTNNLKPKRHLEPHDIESFTLLMAALLRCAEKSKILMTGTPYRMDIPNDVVDGSNEKRKQAVEELDKAAGGERLFWQPAPSSLATKEYLVDHVHFTEKGYELWDEDLYPEIKRLLGESVGAS
jgi:lysophospholipase L1-like esterase